MIDLMDVVSRIDRAFFGIRVCFNAMFPPFTNVESKIFLLLREHISEKYLDRYDEHLGKINYVQRDVGTRLVRMYTWRPIGVYSWDRNDYFDKSKSKERLLKFSILLPSSLKVHCSLVAIEGVICNLTMSEDVAKFSRESEIELISVSGKIKKKRKK